MLKVIKMNKNELIKATNCIEPFGGVNPKL